MRRRLLLISAVFLLAQTLRAWPQAQKDPLNDEEIDQVREYGDRPNDRLKLYAKFIQQRIDAIKELTTDKKTPNRPAQLHVKIEEFTRLADELQDNLDTYDQEHADIRKALKDIVTQSDRWLPILQIPPPDPEYDFARKTAVEAARSLNDQLKELQKDQTQYFAEHKDQAGKNGTGPQ